MNAFTLAEFGEFFAGVHDGQAPFPWQERLAARVLSGESLEQAWPEAITLPTASGKTACLDIAVFALAAQADVPPAERTTPRRICFVVDRRIIVDEAFEHAHQLTLALQNANSGVLKDVADRLRKIAGDTTACPLACFQLRGGIYRDNAWAGSPTQPTIMASTVDQIGSSLLFRGYGVSDLARPIHAGLAGNDTLILLDEAHCAEPFMETMRAVSCYRKWQEVSENNLFQPPPFRLVVLSATPPRDCRDRFPSSPDELMPDLAHAVLGPRLKAAKPVVLKIAEKAHGKKFVEPLAEFLAHEAESLVSEKRRVIAIIVNRVATARAIHKRLEEKYGGRTLLLTGRMRPIDRERVLDGPAEEFKLSTHAAANRKFSQPVFVVATQCLEVGADMDFDGLVTECASLDALRQRFGRLNRGGRSMDSTTTITATPAVIVIRTDQTEPVNELSEQDPVYGNALAETWQQLKRWEPEGIDFGVEALRPRLEALGEDDGKRLQVESSHAPVMFPAHVDCWGQTAPEPVPSPDVSLFLHGPRPPDLDVQICWRADLPVKSANGEEDESTLKSQWVDILTLCPPAAAECLPVPVWLVRRWLVGEGGSEFVADVDAHAPDGDFPARNSNLPVFMWRGPDKSDFVASGSDVSPGAVLVFPAEIGVPEGFGYIPYPGTPQPGGAASYLDVGDTVQLTTRCLPVLRITPQLIAVWPEDSNEIKFALNELIDPEQTSVAARLDDKDFIAALRDNLGKLATINFSSEWKWLSISARWLDRELRNASRRRYCLHPHPSGGIIIRALRRMPRSESSDSFADEELAVSGAASRPVPLNAHSAGVAQLAEAFAAKCGLPDRLRKDIKLAAQFHDAGKADPRFQSLLLGGVPRSVIAGSILLAKSPGPRTTREAKNKARECSGYPPGARHELLSVCLLNSVPHLLESAHDGELVLHLIASSHGHCRPFAPVVEDIETLKVEWQVNGDSLTYTGPTKLEHISSGVTERFWRLTRRYGWWGLAYLETMLRLADHRQSEQERKADDEKD